MELRNKAIKGFIWKLLEKVGNQFVSLVVQIVLARLLLPEEFGLIGYLTIFIAVSDILVEQGFASALIQKKDVDEIDFSSVFYVNLIVSIFVYAILFFCAPFLASFYGEPELCAITRIYLSSIILNAFGVVHNTILSKGLDFKKSFFRHLFGTISYGGIAIYLAYNGFGVWALIYGRLVGYFVGVVVLWVSVRWYPKSGISFERIKVLFAFSSRILGTRLLNTIFNNVNSLIVGRFYTSSDLGLYQRGQNIPQTVMGAVDGSMSEVMYPTFSKLQDDLPKLKSSLRRSMKLSTFVVFPMLIGLLVVTKPLIVILLTEKWLPCVPYMQLMCIICMFWPLAKRLEALNALGLSKLTFRISIIVDCVLLVFIMILANYSIIHIMVGTIVLNFFSVVYVSYYTKKHLNYSFKELCLDLLPNLIPSILIGVLVFCVGLLPLNIYIALLIQVICGIAAYACMALLFKNESFYYFLNLMKSKKSKKE